MGKTGLGQSLMAKPTVFPQCGRGQVSPFRMNTIGGHGGRSRMLFFPGRQMKDLSCLIRGGDLTIEFLTAPMKSHSIETIGLFSAG